MCYLGSNAAYYTVCRFSSYVNICEHKYLELYHITGRGGCAWSSVAVLTGSKQSGQSANGEGAQCTFRAFGDCKQQSITAKMSPVLL